MFLRVSDACWRQSLWFSSRCIMFWKMCVTVALCLIFHLGLSEGFFMPASFRKQAPQTTFNVPHWIQTPSSGTAANNGANSIQTGYGNPKDLNAFQQQQPQTLHQSQQQHLQSQTAFSPQLYGVQTTAPKYEPIPFQSVNQAQYVYEGPHSVSLNSYPPNVHLVPCLCPVNREVLEQQSQQLQQSPLAVTPTSPPFPAEANNAAAPPPQQSQKKA